MNKTAQEARARIKNIKESGTFDATILGDCECLRACADEVERLEARVKKLEDDIKHFIK